MTDAEIKHVIGIVEETAAESRDAAQANPN